MIIPPLNYATVCRGIHRSGYPVAINFPFLELIKIKTILCLSPDILKEETVEFAEEKGIQIYTVDMLESKEPFIGISNKAVTHALEVLSDTRNHPILVHCDRGKFRTGVVVACLRRAWGGGGGGGASQAWALGAAVAEYLHLAGVTGGSGADRARPLDLLFIELYRFPPPPWSMNSHMSSSRHDLRKIDTRTWKSELAAKKEKKKKSKDAKQKSASEKQQHAEQFGGGGCNSSTLNTNDEKTATKVAISQRKKTEANNDGNQIDVTPSVFLTATTPQKYMTVECNDSFFSVEKHSSSSTCQETHQQQCHSSNHGANKEGQQHSHNIRKKNIGGGRVPAAPCSGTENDISAVWKEEGIRLVRRSSSRERGGEGRNRGEEMGGKKSCCHLHHHCSSDDEKTSSNDDNNNKVSSYHLIEKEEEEKNEQDDSSRRQQQQQQHNNNVMMTTTTSL